MFASIAFSLPFFFFLGGDSDERSSTKEILTGWECWKLDTESGNNG